MITKPYYRLRNSDVGRVLPVARTGRAYYGEYLGCGVMHIQPYLVGRLLYRAHGKLVVETDKEFEQRTAA